jgi:predicted transcriptional regulator
MGLNDGFPMSAVSAKEEVEQLLDLLPDDSTLEDIQYHLYVLEKIKRGRADIAAGRRYSQDEAKQRLARWLQK